MQIVPQASIIEGAVSQSLLPQTLSFHLFSLDSLSSTEPYIYIPSDLESPVLILTSIEFVIPEVEAAAESVGQALTWTTALLLIGTSISQLVLQSSMESMWVLICINQLISYFPLMSISFPPNMLLLFNILSFFNGQLYILILAYEYSVGLFFNFPQEPFPYNDKFGSLGFDSVKLMDNSGVFISIWIFLFFFVVILLVCRKICRTQCCFRTTSRLLKCLIWGPVLRTFLVTFLELGFSAYINMVFIRFGSLPDLFSSGISLAVLLTLLILPFIFLHILSATPSTLQNEQYKRKFGQIYKDLDYANNFVAGFYYPIFILHRFLFIGIIFGLSFSGRLQCSLMIVATLIFLWYLIKGKPFSRKLDGFLNVLATILLISLFGFSLAFTFLDQSRFRREREIIGYVFIVLVLGFFGLTCLLILISKVRECVKRKSKKKIQNQDQTIQFETSTGQNLNSIKVLPRFSQWLSRSSPNLQTSTFTQNYRQEQQLEQLTVTPFQERRKPLHF